ncbi:cytokinin riboside 5'-monophosphate phosphoribohydrolase LOG7 [Citrus sinensis]|uniref:Cytokinin riboside 5'-monophosphate phosphoribohydrolase n=2 Tax=Citrus TaxID=2706 RepID=A0A067DJE1_CITSI|nr:cytokinin riboside 5'-monophosphate phosphoribohydrolase LOG7 [Citrus sinensis]KDO41660.1 hypothetical protein CISIN_1g044681mg [Citrus sinensis]GAY63526.1 hypothetical protein CUMW_226300 [Citrus unshiu]
MEEKKEAKSRFKRVCVFCGSSPDYKYCYRKAAIDLGNELVSKGLDLVYGGGNVGLMGLISEEVHRGRRHVLGIIPRALMKKELTGVTLGEVKPVDHMHQRKAEMARYADCFIVLPGGFGTLEKLFEVTTWSQLGVHNKPVAIIMVSASNAKELVQKLEDYEPSHDGVVAKAEWDAEKAEASTFV